MIAKNQILENVQLAVMDISNKIGKSIPEVKYAQPLIKRWLRNNIDKTSNWLNLFTEPDGTIDVSMLFDEYLEIILESDIVEFELPMLGKASFGNGSIKFTIPYINKKVGIEYTDLLEIKETLIKNII